MVMVNVVNVEVAANARTVEAMVTDRKPSIIALPQKSHKKYWIISDFFSSINIVGK